jgi:glycosyltransferase involved in cell wall biosynthesis
MKQTLFISCPIDTLSGYGARSRDIVKALIKHDKYDIKVISQRWGSTPFGALDRNDPEDQKILNLIWNQPQLPFQPDIWIQITVPNEFQAVGKYNIGVTAGIETTLCDVSWIEGCNRMNLILASSNHAKQVFQSTSFEKKDKNTNQTVEVVKLTRPVEVLFEGVDLTKYNFVPDDLLDGELVESLDEIEEEFCYLFVGHWLQGVLGEDRKNVGYLIKAFSETFKNRKVRPALILKTNSATCSIMDREDILKKIDEVRKTVKGDLPNVYLLHGELEDRDVNQLYNHPKVKAMVSLTKGEGFGRPLLEFSLAKKPIIASAWSGHMDFLNPEWNVLVGGELKQVHPSAVVQNMILDQSQWFSPNESETGNKLKDVYENYKKYAELAKRQAFKSRTEFSFDKMVDVLDNILTVSIPKQAEFKPLALPKLKKIE